ncbi:MAG: DUF1080 domain-containing protein [Verrucomicrobiales bacterium]|nr:DUF1080 domain-containing protein [Verrucomicrobiales bacterium]
MIFMRNVQKLSLAGALAAFLAVDLSAADAVNPPAGFKPLFNGQNLDGWWGAGTEDPRKWMALSPEEFAKKREASIEDIRAHWRVENGELVNDGEGLYLTTDGNYGDYELVLEYRTVPKADSGVYLKGVPQVQIWDYTEEGGKWNIGADKGSGGLWNNSAGAPGKDPLVLADKPFGEWNKFRIIQVGSRTWVWLNDQPAVINAIMENYFDRKTPIPPAGPVQLQTHGGEIRWRNVFLREIGADESNRLLRGPDPDGFKLVFNGRNLDGWDGPLNGYEVRDGILACKPHAGGTIFTKQEYGDFMVRLEFRLPPYGNNGLAIRYPGSGNTAYDGMCELQVLDNSHPEYASLDRRQYHGSAYGMVPAQRGYLRPVGQWNYQEVTVKGSTIKVELNGSVILDCDLSGVTEFMNGSAHPGKDLKRGHFGFAGHSSPVEFRNIAIKSLD